MKHVIIGTAGHIDHGKTSLIRALTGRNTDRLAEEQKRGITIDLGFTWFDLKDGTRCGIVDVPGHEKYIHNMAAGAAGMDLVLLVVAADEGIMPQTVEHLDILELLGIKKTILVFTKCDLADPEWMEMVGRDAAEQFRGTVMENAPSVRVSSVTGEGLDELQDLILDMVRNRVEAKEVSSIPRLPVDRVFSVPGFGTVVTGTLMSGRISKGDELTVFPSGIRTKVRGIQVHEIPQEICEAGQRTALNLMNVSCGDIRRGCVLAPADSMEPTTLIDVQLRLLAHAGKTIRNRSRLHLYTGTSEILCRASLLDRDELVQGENCPAQLLCEEPLTVKRGDRFVVRFYSPPETIGGGIILEANAVKKKRFRADVLAEMRKKQTGSPADILEMRIREEKENPVSVPELAKKTGASEEELKSLLEELTGRGSVAGLSLKKETRYWHEEEAWLCAQKICGVLKRYREKYPYRAGVPKAEIRSTCMSRVKVNVFDACVRHMAEKGLLAQEGDYICLPETGILKDGTYRKVEALLKDAFEQAGYRLLRLTEVDRKGYPEDTMRDILRVMEAEGQAVRVSDDPEIYTMKAYMDRAETVIRDHFRKEKVLTLIQVKELFGTNRKSARAIISYTDMRKITVKTGAETEREAYR